MARDVEFNVTASDKVGNGLASAERKFKASQDRIKKQSEKDGLGIGKSLLDGIGKFSPKLAGTISDSIGMAGKLGGPALAVGIAAATPLIGATISAAIIGGAGLGGVIGGVALAARDPRVKAAGAQLGHTMLTSLEQNSKGFVDPVLRNIDKIDAKFASMGGRIKRIFDNSSKFLDPLVDGALIAVDGILRGFDSLVAKAGPSMRALGSLVGHVGQAIGDAFDMIAGGGDDAALAIKTIELVLVSTIRSFGIFVRATTEAFGFLIKPTLGVAGALGLIDKKTKDAADSALKATPPTTGLMAALGGVGDKAAAGAGPIATFTDRVNNLADAGRNAFDATTSLGEATDRARAALEKNGRTLSANTEKGRENRQALSAVRDGLLATYNNYVKLNGEGQKSNAVAASNRAAFIKLATQFGASKREAERLASQMGLIPAKKNSDFYLNTHDAAGRAKAAQSAINSVKGRTVDVNIRILNAGRLSNIENRLNRLGGSMYNAAGPSWAALDSNSGTARTGGPAPVSVSNNVSVALDGVPFYAMTVHAVRASSERDAWRTKVGKR